MKTSKRVGDVPNCALYLVIERESNAAEWLGLGDPLAFANFVLLPVVGSCEGRFEVYAL
jgi:hypothetical protein